jgi:hypothetical protein
VSQQPRGALVTTVARFLSFLMGAVSLVIIWEDRRTWPWLAVAVLGAYAVFAVTAALWARKRGQGFALKAVHDVLGRREADHHARLALLLRQEGVGGDQAAHAALRKKLNTRTAVRAIRSCTGW